ncbi:MAG: hypothetical protein JNK87_20165 [Bryobacterales bacterium]|nr:hypothetical protein [Bryobacterales bacterium]
MATINVLKEQEATDTPIALFEIGLAGGGVLRLSTHALTHEGVSYSARIVRHEPFELKIGGDGSDSNGRLSLTLANPDSYFSGIDPVDWRGASVTARFCFFDLTSGVATSETRVVFRGVCGGAEEITEEAIRLIFHNRLGLQRVWLPTVRLQRTCPWLFPADNDQRQEAVAGGSEGTYSAFYRCGYSAGEVNGAGNLNGGQPYTSCGYTKEDCAARGMLDSDSSSSPTARFGGFPILPEPGAGRVELAPLIYGTGWCDAPVVNVWRESDRVRAEAIVAMGRIEGVLKVLANGYELREAAAGGLEPGTYRVMSLGDRIGTGNTDMPTEGGPYGSFAYVVVCLPQNAAPASTQLRISVLAQGLRLPWFNTEGGEQPAFYTNNPIWVLLDIVRRAGWRKSDVNLGSFATAAAVCDELVEARDRQGSAVWIPRYRCNLVLQSKRSLADVIRGLRASTGLILGYDEAGKLQVSLEGSLATQQPDPPAGTNAEMALDGGWPCYEFGDGTAGRSGIARTSQGASSLRLWTRAAADVPNRFSLEYTDEFNQYRRDSLSLVDVTDVSRGGQELNGTVGAMGVPNQSQALRTLHRHLRRSTEGNLYVEFETSVKGVMVAPGGLITITYLREGLNRVPFRVLTVGYGTNLGRIRIVAQKHADSWYQAEVRSIDGGMSTGEQGGVPRPLLGSDRVGSGTAFALAESAVIGGDGRMLIVVSAGFAEPGQAGVTPPRVSPEAEVTSGAGTISGPATLYYAITALGTNGMESAISSTVRAVVPAGTGFGVQLNGIDIGDAAAMNVYRGADPQRLERIASAASPSVMFVDTGLSLAQVLVPPDANYDQARFYWRWELQPPLVATSWSTASIGNATLSMGVNAFAGKTVRIVAGSGAGQERRILSNTIGTLTVTPSWSVQPDATSQFAIAESGWNFATSGKASPVSFEVSNRPGATIQVMARAASASGVESDASLSPVSRWQIEGDAGSSLDTSVPPIPLFSLSPTGRGTVELTGIGFSTLENTRSISSGTLMVHYWNEVGGVNAYSLAGAVGIGDTVASLNVAGPGQIGTLLQIGTELLEITGVNGTEYQLARGRFGTATLSHSVGAPVMHLARRVEVVAFPDEFFGSPASGSYAYNLDLPNVRIAAAELFVSNSRGISLTRQLAYTGLMDSGLRTLSGGQYSIQVEGLLAIQESAAPALIVEDSHSVRDIYARVKQAPTGSPVQMVLRQNGNVYCSLTIATGATVSNVVSGVVAGPLWSQSALTLDITSIGTGGLDFPGQDLTVTIRL